MRKKMYFLLVVLMGITMFFGTTNAQWTELTTGVSYDFKALSIPTPDVVWASGQDGKIIKSINGGSTWVDVSLPVPGGGAHTSWNLFAVDANTALASTIEWGPYTAHLFRTSNGGANWNEVLSQTGTMFNNVWIYPDNTAFLVGDQLGDGYWVTYKSIDGGVTWTQMLNAIPCKPTEYGYNNSLFVRDGITYFAGTEWDFSNWTVLGAYVYKSTNLVNWEVFDASAGVVNPNITAPNCLWLNNGNKGFINGAYTVNGGRKWHKLISPDPMSTILTLVGYQQKLWAITSTGDNLNVYYTNNHGNKWSIAYSPVIPGAVNNQLTGSRIFNEYITLYLIRSNGSVAKYTEMIEDYATGKNLDVYKLLNNYPNPFNPTTTIRFELPKNEFVTLKVYDMTGREVANLVNETRVAGTHQVMWNASGLPSGTYFYKLSAGSFSEVKKMILVK
ncbi:MAG: T9SS type A sorting domain-containing protein [Ignavibacteria bacterium]|nr:T9SS type A sorting domain-containing protein [Ignavibacteria bacterium]